MEQLSLNTTIELKDFGEQMQLKLRLNQDIGIKLCKALLLLKQNLSKIIKIQFENFSITLKISGDNYSHFEFINKKAFKGLISIYSLEYIINYILKIYRDGIAETEHIDIDFASDSGKDYTLTISCDNHREYSEEEIRKILE